MKKTIMRGKKLLSVLLTLTLMLTTFICFDIGVLFGSAVDVSAAITVSDNTIPDVYFFAPEQVYLEPSISERTAQDKYNFQWFVDSEFNEETKLATPRKGENAEGNFYFYYENASKVTISYKYLNSDFTDMIAYTSSSVKNDSANYVNSSCSVKFSTYSTPLRALNSSGSSTYTYYTVEGNKINTMLTNESISPYLLASTRGCYIEWRATFVDKLDGQTKVAYAYTYVYKPYIQPAGVVHRTKNWADSSHFGQDIGWVSGVHSVDSTGTDYPKASLGSKSLLPFSSTNPKGVKVGVTETNYYAQFANANQSEGYFYYSDPYKESAVGWITSDGSQYLPVKSMVYSDCSEGGTMKTYSVYNLATAPTSRMTVDVSRYTNLNQIPNVSGGLLVTDDDSSEKGAWYVADGTGKTDRSTAYKGKEGGSSKASEMFWNYKSIIASQGDFDNKGKYQAGGVKYNGGLNIQLLSTSNGVNTYNFRTCYHNVQSGDRITNVAVMPIVVTQTNKEELREIVTRATSLVAKFGLKLDGSSTYYNCASWSKFTTLYKLAGRMLANMELSSTMSVSGYNLSTIVSELDSVISQISSEEKISSTATVRFLTLSKTASGYKLTEVYDLETGDNVPDATKRFSYGQSIDFKAIEFKGYSYVGACTGLKKVGTKTGEDYSSLIGTEDSSFNVGFATKTSTVQYTFLYLQLEYSAIIDPRSGDYNYLHIINENFPLIGGMGFPTYSADPLVETDFNYIVEGNDVTAWTSEETTLAKYQFLPYAAELEGKTEYKLSYKVTGTDAANVSLSLYGESFTGGNGESSSFYQFDGSASTIVTNAVDKGTAYLRLELLGGARDGQKIMISDICLSKTNRNELYIQTSTQYPLSFTATRTDKMGMSYSVSSNMDFTVTSQYNSSTYDQRQLLPLYVNLKANSTYVITYEVEGTDASNVLLDFVNDSFTGGNGTTATSYSVIESGAKIVIGAADDGIGQLKVSYARSVAANTTAKIKKLSVVNLDNKITVSGSFNDSYPLGIPVKEGYKFAGWSVKSNDGKAMPYGSVTESYRDNIYNYRFGIGTDIIEAKWEIDTFKVIFRDSDGSVLDEQIVAYGKSAQAPAKNPYLFGHTFKGWDTDFSKVTSDLIIEPIFDEIDIEVILDKTTASYYEDAVFDIQASFNPNEPEISDVVWTTSDPKIAIVTGKPGDVGTVTCLSAGTATITATVTYDKKTYSKSCTVTVKGKYPVSMEIISDPAKTRYYTGEKFDPTGMSIQITYNNGTVSDYIEYPFTALRGTVNIAHVDTSTAGTKTVEISYTDNGATVSDTTSVNVISLTPKKIVFSGEPFREYYVDDECEFDPTGLVVTITYSDGNSITYDASQLDITYGGFDTSEEGVIMMIGVFQNLSGRFYIEILPVEFVGVEIYTLPDKTEYFVGEEFDQTGLSLYAVFNNGRKDAVDAGISCTGFSSETKGVKTITATYEGESTTFEIEVFEIEMTSIEIKTMPNKLSYYTGDTLEVDGLTLTGIYNNGNTETITEGFTCGGYNLDKSGKQTVTVDYNGLTASFDISVTAVKMTSLKVNTMPNKVTYYIGESFDQTGLTLIAGYNNGKTSIIESGFRFIGFNSQETGTNTIIVSYGGKATTFKIEVLDVIPISISLKSLPKKTTYFVGESFDMTGLTVNVAYNNGTDVDLTEGFECSYVDLSEAGTKKVTVSVDELTADFEIIVKAIELVSVEITTLPNKTAFHTGDELDTTGLVLTLSYNNGVTVPVTDGFTTDGYDKSTAGAQTITVKYGGFSDTYSITVLQSYANYDEVDAAITAANAKLAEGIYTEESVAALNEAINAVVRNLTAEEQSTVDAYALDIVEKTEALLEKPASYTALDAAIAAQNTEIAKNLYTAASVAEFNAMVNGFDRALGISQQTTVDGYTAQVNEFVFEYKLADYTELDALVAEVNALDSTLYSNYDEIYNTYIFNYVFSVIPSNRSYNITEQNKVDEMKTTLQSYVDMLQLKDVQVAKFELKNGAAYKSGSYIVGLAPELTAAAIKNNYFVMENVSVSVRKAVSSSRYIGTGSVVTVTNDLTGTVIGTYTIIIYGDVNGDGSINVNDSISITNIVSGGSATTAQKMAARISGGRNVSLSDYINITNVIQGYAEIDQVRGTIKSK